MFEFCKFFFAPNHGKIWLHKTLIGCSRKNFIRGNLIFLNHFLLFDWAWSKLHQPIQTIGSLNSQDMIRIRKHSRHDFSGKHLRDGYCMDIIWCLCVEVKIQQRVILFCKSFFKNCCYMFPLLNNNFQVITWWKQCSH